LTKIWEDESDLRIAIYILKYFEEFGMREREERERERERERGRGKRGREGERERGSVLLT
jgi:hypothetical protein